LISGFGKFSVKGKNQRRGRNPQTGDPIILSPRSVLPLSAPVFLERKSTRANNLPMERRSHYKRLNSSGGMIAKNLMRDLSVGKVFQTIVPAAKRMPAACGTG